MKTIFIIALFIGLLVLGWVFAKVVWALLPVILVAGAVWYLWEKHWKGKQ